MEDGYLAEIRLFAGNFAPRGWMFCSGQILAINENAALYSLLGTAFGGDGRSTYGLPDLRSRVPMGSQDMGIGPGLSVTRRGEKIGVQTETTPVSLTGLAGSVTLTEANMPLQSHSATFTQTDGHSTVPAVDDEANTEDPTDAKLAIPTLQGTSNKIYSNATGTTHLAVGTATVKGTVAITNSGNANPTPIQISMQGSGSTTINPIQPSTGLNYIICTQGLFPSRS